MLGPRQRRWSSACRYDNVIREATLFTVCSKHMAPDRTTEHKVIKHKAEMAAPRARIVGPSRVCGVHHSPWGSCI